MSDQIDVNQLSNAIQQKVDLPSGKSQADIDYVVESQAPTSENDYTWYRLYKSGWVEQGGEGSAGSSISLPKAMSNTHYILVTNVGNITENSHSFNSWIYSRDISSFVVRSAFGDTQYNYRIVWQVSGMSAQS